MFALFRAYGIPTISAVLCSTAQFASPATSDKRITDTGLLLLEAMLNPLGHGRSLAAPLASITCTRSTGEGDAYRIRRCCTH